MPILFVRAISILYVALRMGFRQVLVAGDKPPRYDVENEVITQPDYRFTARVAMKVLMNGFNGWSSTW